MEDDKNIFKKQLEQNFKSKLLLISLCLKKIRFYFVQEISNFPYHFSSTQNISHP
jgi:hypothetical protein